MAFFQGAQSVKIVGGAFNNVEGNLVIHVQNRHVTNLDSHNVGNNKLYDNALRISRQSD